MPKRIYVGNLPFDVTRHEVDNYFRGNAHLFDSAPRVDKLKRDDAAKSAQAVVVIDTGDATAVAAAMHGTTLGGNTLVASTDRSVVVHHDEIP